MSRFQVHSRQSRTPIRGRCLSPHWLNSVFAAAMHSVPWSRLQDVTPRGSRQMKWSGSTKSIAAINRVATSIARFHTLECVRMQPKTFSAVPRLDEGRRRRPEKYANVS